MKNFIKTTICIALVALAFNSCRILTPAVESPQVQVVAPAEVEEPVVKRNLLISTSTQKKVSAESEVHTDPLQADLIVSPEKIKYFMLVSESVRNGGEKNVISTAIWEALAANGDADVLVNPQTQIKYDRNEKIESITITGYPAKYVNFRKASNSSDAPVDVVPIIVPQN